MIIKKTITIDNKLFEGIKKHTKENGQTFSGLISVLLNREIKK